MAQTQAQAEWYQKNKEFCKEKTKQYQKENRQKITEWNREWASKNRESRLLTWAKFRAKQTGLECTITKDDIHIPQHCPYLGINLQEKGYSLDRIDNTKGYIPGNVEVISRKANRMKSNATFDELYQFATVVINRYSTTPYKEL